MSTIQDASNSQLLLLKSYCSSYHLLWIFSVDPVTFETKPRHLVDPPTTGSTIMTSLHEKIRAPKLTGSKSMQVPWWCPGTSPMVLGIFSQVIMANSEQCRLPGQSNPHAFRLRPKAQRLHPHPLHLVASIRRDVGRGVGKKDKKTAGEEESWKKKRVEKLFGNVCLFVWVEYLFGWDAIGWLDGICFYDWMDWICMSLHFWEPLFWTLPPTWTQYVEAYGHPTKRTKKNQYQIYQSNFWHWFETRLFVSMISSCSPPKNIGEDEPSPFWRTAHAVSTRWVFPSNPN